MYAQIRLENFLWETGDGVFIDGDVELQKGRRGSSVNVGLADPRLELASKLPLPLRAERPVVEVAVGPTNQRLDLVFSGHLSELTASGLPGRVQLRATGRAHKLRVQERAQIRSDLSALHLVREFAQEDGLTVDASRAPELERVRWASVCMYGETGADALDRLLPATGHTWFLDGNTLVVEATDKPEQLLEVLYGSDVRNGFEFRIEELRRGTTPNIYSLENDQLYAEETDDVAITRVVSLERTGLTLAAAQAPAMTSQAEEYAMQAQSRARKLFRGRLEFTTVRPELRLKHALMLRGFGPRFSGVWFVESIRHPLSGGGGTTVEIYNGGA